MSAQAIAETLVKSGFCVCPDFFSAGALKETREDLENIDAAGGFRRAGVGHGIVVHDEVRRDEICWLDRDLANAVQLRLWDRLDLLKQAFNSPPLYLGVTRFEGHYASYPKGGYYKRHLDRAQTQSNRVVSFILYLNQNWRSEDGGRLRIFDGEQAPHSFTDVDPIGGTMVCFLSDEFEHEVLPSQTQRRSFCGWFQK